LFQKGAKEQVPYRVFLSHSYSDKEAVAAVHDQLVAGGIDVWTSEQHPQPGRQLSEKILEAIAESDALVVLLTEASSVSQYVHQEIGAALQAKKPVFPLATFDVPPDRLGMLAGVEWLRVDLGNVKAGTAELSAGLAKRADLKGQQQALSALMLVGLVLILALATKSE
jgi:hypothetical protein